MVTIFMIILILTINGVNADGIRMVQLYPQTMVVTSIDYDTDTVFCEDFNGNLWSFEGCEDWSENDICSLIMCDNGTDIIYDDIIISKKYSGYVDN